MTAENNGGYEPVDPRAAQQMPAKEKYRVQKNVGGQGVDRRSAPVTKAGKTGRSGR